MSNPRIPSLSLLIGFEAAARHGNFSRAAEELHLSQSAISHQISQLEEQLHLPLFRRVGRGVELTVAGDVLQLSVQRALAILRNGLGRIANYHEPGLVVLVCPAYVQHGWLQWRLSALQQALPDLCLLLSTDESANFVDEIDVDISISAHALRQPGLQEQMFLQDEWLIVATPKIANSLASVDLAQHHQFVELLCLEESFTGEACSALFLNQLAAFRKRTIYDDQRLVLDACLRGRGIACLPALLVNECVHAGQLQVLPGYPRLPGASWWLSAVAGTQRSVLVTQVRDWLLQQARDDLPQGGGQSS